MRLIPILIIAVALATSGCFGKDDEGGDPPAGTTPAGTTPSGTTPTGTTPVTTPTNTTPEPPEAVTPVDLCSVSFNYQGNTQAGTPPTHTSTADCGTMAAGYTKLTLNVTFAATGVVLSQDISVSVVDADGAPVVTCTGPGPGAAPEGGSACSQEATAAPGAYTLVYEGVGNVQVSGAVQAS